MSTEVFTKNQIEWLFENLSLEVKQEDRYNDCCDGTDRMYIPYKSVTLRLAGEVISEINFE